MSFLVRGFNSGDVPSTSLMLVVDIEASAPSDRHVEANFEANWLRATALFIVGTSLGAATVAIAHHAFLAHVDGQPIYAKTQCWIRNGNNVLSITVVRRLLGLSITLERGCFRLVYRRPLARYLSVREDFTVWYCLEGALP